MPRLRLEPSGTIGKVAPPRRADRGRNRERKTSRRSLTEPIRQLAAAFVCRRASSGTIAAKPNPLDGNSAGWTRWCSTPDGHQLASASDDRSRARVGTGDIPLAEVLLEVMHKT